MDDPPTTNFQDTLYDQIIALARQKHPGVRIPQNATIMLGVNGAAVNVYLWVDFDGTPLDNKQQQ